MTSLVLTTGPRPTGHAHNVIQGEEFEQFKGRKENKHV